MVCINILPIAADEGQMWILDLIIHPRQFTLLKKMEYQQTIDSKRLSYSSLLPDFIIELWIFSSQLAILVRYWLEISQRYQYALKA